MLALPAPNHHFTRMDLSHGLIHDCVSVSESDRPFSCSIRDIPQEVLTRIFSFLSASDRGNVRSTCSAWYDACNVPRILETEKLHIRSTVVEGSSEKLESLSACQFKYLNLVFEKFQFCQSSISFWKHCGERISSLTFHECFFENGLIIGEILMECSNLLTLEIIDFGELSKNTMAAGLTLCSTVVRKKLVSLKLRNCDFLNDFTYSMMVRIFPNIRELFLELVNLNCYKRVDKRFYLCGVGPYVNEDIFSFTCVFDHLRSVASQLKSLSFHSIGDKGLTSDWLDDIAMVDDLRLSQLSLEGHLLFSEPSLINLLSKQTSLTKLVLRRCPRISYSAVLKVGVLKDENIEFS